MASLYARGGKLWCRLKDESGKWVSKPTPYTVEERRQAKRYAESAQRTLDARRENGTTGPLTVARYLDRWTEERKQRVASAPVDHARLKTHAMGKVGSLLLAEVTPRHVRDLVRHLRTTDLAPRSQLHVFRTLHTMFESAVVDELVTANPVKVKPGELPKKTDADPEWRSLATFTVHEVERLISDPAIPPERRVMYALKAIAGLRHGEAAALCWRHLDHTAEPLARINVVQAWCSRTQRVKGTKTGDTRAVPMHATLAKILATWKLTGWVAVYGRKPTDDDYIAPARTMRPGNAGVAGRAFTADLARLGLRVDAGDNRDRGGHDLRGWYKTRTIEDGADSLIIRRTTHAPPRDVDSGYQRFSWATVCREVAKLKVTLLDGQVTPLATALATRHTRDVSSRGRWLKKGAETHGNRTHQAAARAELHRF